MFAQFRDQDHAFPAVVLQGRCDIVVGTYQDGDEAIGVDVMVAPLGLCGRWCGVLIGITADEADALAQKLAVAAARVRAGDR